MQVFSRLRTLTFALFTLAAAAILLIVPHRTARGHSASWTRVSNELNEIAALKDLAALEPIDAHTHIIGSGPELVALLERLHMHVLDILYVDDTQESRASLDRQRLEAVQFIAASHDYATLCTTFDPFRMNSPNFTSAAIAGLNNDFSHGAVAAKVWKNVGMEIKNAKGHYVLPDDPLFEPIYRDIAKQHKTLIIHAAAVDAAWQQPTGTEKYFEHNPQWEMWRIPDAPRKEDILRARDRLLEMNPDLRVVGAHLGSMEERLPDLGARFDRYPNFAVDVSGRVHQLAQQPRTSVRDFILKYQDRIIYGTDLEYPLRTSTGQQEISAIWQKQYLLDWRFFATDDTFDYRGHNVQGLQLPHPVLQKLYHDNAVRWIPGVLSNRH
jgi:predicted TIM-barrel fold metal-dependent hydrolase